jgi:hypothetical protein
VLGLARRQPSAVLLTAQLAALLVYPFLEDEGVGRAIFSAMGLLFLGLVFLSVRTTPALTWIAVLLGGPATVLADHEVTRDELFAVGATFTLVAWGFAYVYTVVQAVEPGSFTAAIDPQQQRTWMELLFLSFTTLTSTGLSDVVPVEPFARSTVMIEQLAGLGYVAMIVSRLVGLTIRRPGVD